MVVMWPGAIDTGVCVAAAAAAAAAAGMRMKMEMVVLRQKKVLVALLLGWTWRTCSRGALHLPAQMTQQCCR
jgi:hypothetical protein